MLKIGLGIFLIAHGLVQAILAVAPNPSDDEAKPGAFFTTAERSWLLPEIGLSAQASAGPDLSWSSCPPWVKTIEFLSRLSPATTRFFF